MPEYILIITIYIVMENKETNPTIVVGNDDKKEEPKKDDSAKSDK